MSVIQNIQEKYAKLMAIIIAIALITFVVMLAFENGGNLFRSFGTGDAIGKVNGKAISYNEFLNKVDLQEANMQQQYGGMGGAMIRHQAVENAWNQQVNEIIQDAEYEKLGISVTTKEMGDILYGENPPEDLKRQFTDSSGIYNAQLAKQNIDQMLRTRSGSEEQMQGRAQLINYLNYLERNRADEKYRSLFANSVNVPKWLVEKEIADKSKMANVSLVKDFYSLNSDSTIKVSDKEIQDYINKNKDFFKQPQDSRSIAYVSFSAVPTAADSAEVRDRVLALKTEFDTTKDLKRFLSLQGVRDFDDTYKSLANIQSVMKDTLVNLPVGTVYGPYLDGGNYTLAKLIGVRTQPDSVSVRHILVGTETRDPQTGQPIPVRDTVTAKKLADSIALAIRNGSSFDSLLKLSDDPGSVSNGGKYDNVYSGQMVAEFNDFIFTNPPGSKGVVKTQFGYHYIEILSQKGSSRVYKIAFLPKRIEASAETEQAAENEANLFAGNSRDQKSFDANAEKLKAKGINKNVATDITPMAYQIPGLGMSRSLVKNIYKADVGDVLDPERVGDNYVVAIVTGETEEGLIPVSKARPQVEPILINKKIAEKLAKKLGNPATLEAAAAALGNKPIETIDSLRMGASDQVGEATALSSEPKVRGAAFYPANKGKVVVIQGANAIFALRVDDVIATSVGTNLADERKLRNEQAKQQSMYRSPAMALREGADIKDRRSEFF